MDNDDNPYLNSDKLCIVCFKEPVDNLNLIKHHVTYFPEKLAYVHFDCHRKIHDPDNPLTVWIQYQPDDSRKFYQQGKET